MTLPQKEKGPNEVGAGNGFQWSKAPELDDLMPMIEVKLLEGFRDIKSIVCRISPADDTLIFLGRAGVLEASTYTGGLESLRHIRLSMIIIPPALHTLVFGNSAGVVYTGT